MSDKPNPSDIRLEVSQRLTSKLTIYQSLDVQKAAIPPRSRLYHLEPIGLRTPYVESLTSYVARLAEQHCVTVRQLILTEIAPIISKIKDKLDAPVTSISKVFGIERDRTALNGMGLVAAQLVHALSVLTQRSDLRFLTLLPWAQVISKRGLLRTKRAWCPICYQQWFDNNKNIYEPLLWSINVIEFCPYHHYRLLSLCPHCHQQQLVISGDSRPGFCSKCRQWLGNCQLKKSAANLIELAQQPNYYAVVAYNLGELMAAAPSFASPLKRSRISEVISTYINQFWFGNVALVARLSGMQEATLSAWIKGKTIPQVEQLLKLTDFLKISLLDFLTAAPISVDSQKNPPQLLPVQLKKQRKPYKQLNADSKQILNLVLQQVIREYPPPSLQDVALRLKYRPLVLQHHFPSLCREIKVRHADYIKVRRQQKIQPVLEAALNEVPPPSLGKIVRRLGYKNNSYLYKYFPELSREISRRYKEHLKACGVEKRERIRQEIQAIANQLHSQGLKPTQGRVTRLLTKPGVMLNPYARDTLREVQRSLGYDP